MCTSSSVVVSLTVSLFLKTNLVIATTTGQCNKTLCTQQNPLGPDRRYMGLGQWLLLSVRTYQGKRGENHFFLQHKCLESRRHRVTRMHQPLIL